MATDSSHEAARREAAARKIEMLAARGELPTSRHIREPRSSRNSARGDNKWVPPHRRSQQQGAQQLQREQIIPASQPQPQRTRLQPQPQPQPQQTTVPEREAASEVDISDTSATLPAAAPTLATANPLSSASTDAKPAERQGTEQPKVLDQEAKAEREREASLEAAKEAGREKLRREAAERAKKDAERRSKLQQQREQQRQQHACAGIGSNSSRGSDSARPRTSVSVATRLITRNITLSREEREMARTLAREQDTDLQIIKAERGVNVAAETPLKAAAPGRAGGASSVSEADCQATKTE